MKEVIKFLGKKDDLIWIYPKTTISQDAIVEVDRGYQATMVRNGEMDIPYGIGSNPAFVEKKAKFSLFSNKLINDCQLYYFNVSRDVAMREWGTRIPIKYFDKRYNMELTIRGHGTYKIQLENPRLFMNSFKLDSQSISTIESSIKDMVIMKITSSIAKVLTKGEYDLLSIHGYYDEITKAALTQLNTEFEELGLCVFDLRIIQLTPVEEDQINVLKELQFKSVVFDKEFEMVNKVRQANNEDKLIQNQVNNQVRINNELLCSKCNSIINRQMRFCSNCGENIKWIENGE